MSLLKSLPNTRQKILCLTLLVFLLGLVGFVRQTRAYNEAQKCYGNICTKLISDLPAGASRLEENTQVSLNFLIYDTGNPNGLNPCGSGKTIYHVLRHYTGDTSYEYRSNDEGAAFTQDFNSGSANQPNRYEAVFFCDTAPISGTAQNVVDTRLGNLRPKGQVYDVTPFNMKTAPKQATPQIIFNPSPTSGSYTSGATVTIAAQNLPSSLGTAQCGQGTNSNYRMTVKLNGQSTSFYCFPYPFTIKTGAVEGTIDMSGGDNNLEVYISDTSGNILAQNSITFKVGQVSSSTSTTPTVITSTTPTDTLYNPLPVNELGSILLLIMQGFLGVVALWSVTFIVIGGFRYVMSQGNEEALTTARKTITWAILGLVICLLSFSIVTIVKNILQADIKTVGFEHKTSPFQNTKI